MMGVACLWYSSMESKYENEENKHEHKTGERKVFEFNLNIKKSDLKIRDYPKNFDTSFINSQKSRFSVWNRILYGYDFGNRVTKVIQTYRIKLKICTEGF